MMSEQYGPRMQPCGTYDEQYVAKDAYYSVIITNKSEIFSIKIHDFSNTMYTIIWIDGYECLVEGTGHAICCLFEAYMVTAWWAIE